MIEIDKRNDQCAYIKVGDITVYVEAPEFVHVWRNRFNVNDDVSLFLISDGEVQITNKKEEL